MARTYKGWAITATGDGYKARKGEVEIHDVSTKTLCIKIDRINADNAVLRKAEKIKQRAELFEIKCRLCGKPIGKDDICVSGRLGTTGYHKNCFKKEFKGVAL